MSPSACREFSGSGEVSWQVKILIGKSGTKVLCVSKSLKYLQWCGKDPDVHCPARCPSRLSRSPLCLPADPGLFVGVGIFSFARYGKDFYTSKYEGSVKVPQRTVSSDYSIFDNYYIPEITSVLLLRSCKVRCLEKSSFLKGLRWKVCFPQDYLWVLDRCPS